MTSIGTVGSQVSESDIAATLISLRERFEAVRRSEIQRLTRTPRQFESRPNGRYRFGESVALTF
jgi:hypothetical protein